MARVVEANPRGIPKAPFMDNVQDFLGGQPAEVTLSKFQEMISKYKTMEMHTLQRKQTLQSKIPEIEKTLEMVTFLIEKEGTDAHINTNFEMNETLWISAKVKASDKVLLWLGANVMLEYETKDARDLLNEKLGMAKKSLLQVQEDLQFLREQITTVEVNFSRVHNWDVKQRSKK